MTRFDPKRARRIRARAKEWQELAPAIRELGSSVFLSFCLLVGFGFVAHFVVWAVNYPPYFQIVERFPEINWAFHNEPVNIWKLIGIETFGLLCLIVDIGLAVCFALSVLYRLRKAVARVSQGIWRYVFGRGFYISLKGSWFGDEIQFQMGDMKPFAR